MLLKKLLFWCKIYGKEALQGFIWLLGIAIVILLLLFGPKILYQRQWGTYEEEAIGYLIDVTPKKTIKYEITGSEVVISGYDILYAYYVSNKTYRGKQYIASSILSSKQKGLLNFWDKKNHTEYQI